MEIFGRVNPEKGKSIILTFLCAASLFISFSCAHTTDIQSQSDKKPLLLKNVDPLEASLIIKKNRSNPDFVILDVRTPEEFRIRHIEGAINTDYYSSGFREALAALDRDKTYIVYCRTGRRSSETFEVMKSLGFTAVYHISGGMERWLADDLPLVP